MMDAWELLTKISVAPAGSDVWEHLNGLKSSVAMFGDITVEISESKEVVVMSEVSRSITIEEVVHTIIVEKVEEDA